MKSIMHSTKIDIPEKDRIELAVILNSSLASVSDLYLQLKQAHWNVKGPAFIALHQLFDEVAERIEEQVDTIAERVTSLGGTALGTLQATIEGTSLREYPTDIFTAHEHIEHLTHNIALLAEHVRNNITRAEELNDFGTSDLYIGLVRMLDKNLWFLEAHIQK